MAFVFIVGDSVRYLNAEKEWSVIEFMWKETQ